MTMQIATIPNCINSSGVQVLPAASIPPASSFSSSLLELHRPLNLLAGADIILIEAGIMTRVLLSE